MKLYTKTGDDGTTSLLGGTRVPKSHPRVCAYGDIDELNSQLGVCLSLSPDVRVEEIIIRIQHELFTLGADISAPDNTRVAKTIPRITAAHITTLEQNIDSLDAELPELKYFILPGGSAVGASLHLARTICRRAERDVVALSEKESVNKDAIMYLNRLSDLLFVLARWSNQQSGKAEVKWEQ